MTPTRKTEAGAERRSRARGLTTPLVALGIGVAYLLAGWAGGDLGFGVFGLALMAGLAVVLLLVRRRSETLRGLLDRGDERINQIDLTATAVAGITVIVAIIGAFVVEIARGQDGSPYTWLGALGGLAYILAVIVQRLRN